MRIHELGEGTPEVAVVAAIHGDEPCGARAVERLVAEAPAVERPVKLVVANEEALEANARYLDEDLNRAFPGDPNAATHEGRLAHELVRELRGCTTLSLHSTQSYADPFALVDTVDAVAQSICPHLPVDIVVETAPFTEGRLIEHPHTIEAECGLQGTEGAAQNAYWLARAFLAATGVVSAPLADSDGGETDVDEHDDTDVGGQNLPLGRRNGGEVTVYRLREQIPKRAAERYEVFVSNFEYVDAGERFATVDGEPLVAERPFYPVLLSSHGYENVFGYAGEKVGRLG